MVGGKKMKLTKNIKYLTEGRAKELMDDALRTAFREHARELEKHLNDVDARLRALEESKK